MVLKSAHFEGNHQGKIHDTGVSSTCNALISPHLIRIDLWINEKDLWSSLETFEKEMLSFFFDSMTIIACQLFGSVVELASAAQRVVGSIPREHTY